MDGILLTRRVLVCDPHDEFTEQLEKAIGALGVTAVVTSYQAPNCNAHAKRFVRSIKEERLDKTTPFGEVDLGRCLRDSAHDHAEGNHQGIGNELIGGAELAAVGPVECRNGAAAYSSATGARPETVVWAKVMGEERLSAPRPR